MVVYCKELLPYNPVKNSLYKILINSLMEFHMSSSQSGFYQEPSGVSGLYQDVWGG